MKYHNCLFLLAVFITVYFGQSAWKHQVLESIDLVEASERVIKLEKTYHSKFSNTHLYYPNGTNRSILLQIAEAKWELGKNDEAKEAYRKAIEHAPNDVSILLSFARFLLNIDSDESEAKHYLERIYNIQPGHHMTNILLADIYITAFDYIEAREFLNCRYLDRRSDFLKLEELRLYCSDFRKDLLSTNELSFDNELSDYCDSHMVEIMDIRRELLNIGLKESRRRALGLKLSLLLSEFEQDLFKGLDEEGRQIYLQDIAPNLYGWQLWIFNYLTGFKDDGQYKKSIQLFEDHFITQKYCQLETDLKLVNFGSKKIKCLNYDQLAQRLESNLSELLESNQYKLLSSYRKSNPWYLINQL